MLGLLSLEPLPMRQIAQKLKCEPSNVTGIVDRLEARGLVERRPDPGRPPGEAGRRDGGGAAGTARSLRDSLDFAREPLAELSEEERVAAAGAAARMLEARGRPAGCRIARVLRRGARLRLRVPPRTGWRVS